MGVRTSYDTNLAHLVSRSLPSSGLGVGLSVYNGGTGRLVPMPTKRGLFSPMVTNPVLSSRDLLDILSYTPPTSARGDGPTVNRVGSGGTPMVSGFWIPL